MAYESYEKTEEIIQCEKTDEISVNQRQKKVSHQCVMREKSLRIENPAQRDLPAR